MGLARRHTASIAGTARKRGLSGVSRGARRSPCTSSRRARADLSRLWRGIQRHPREVAELHGYCGPIRADHGLISHETTQVRVQRSMSCPKSPKTPRPRSGSGSGYPQGRYRSYPPLSHAEEMRTPRRWVLPTRPVTRADLTAVGVSDEMIRTQLSAGTLLRLRRGVFVMATAWPDSPRDQHLLRAYAEQSANPAAVLSHRTAAVVWGLPTPGFEDWWDGPPTVTLPAADRYRSGQGDVVRHVGALGPAHVTRDDEGHVITSLARTAADLAHGLPVPAALVILDAAARQLVGSLVASPRRRDYKNVGIVNAVSSMLTDGCGSPRRALPAAVLDLVEPCRESPAESLSAGHFHLAGLPRPECQASIRTRRGEVFVDFLWRDARVIGECDGAMKYDDRASIIAEKEREQDLLDIDYRIVRWLGKEPMIRPHMVVERIERVLGA